MCDIDFDDCTSVMSETSRKARKAHRCDSCKGRIEPGQQYTVHFSVYDGEPASEKMCGLCTKDRAEFGNAHGFEWCTPSYFPALLRECIHDGDEESDQRWRPMLDAIKARAVGDRP